MTGVIAIDESGDLGPDGSRYFAMTAIMIRRARDLKKSYNCLMRDAKGHRFYETKDNASSIKVLEAAASSDVRIVYELVDKNYGGPNRIYGNDLYVKIFTKTIEQAMELAPCNDLRVAIDESGFIRARDAERIVREVSEKHGRNLKEFAKSPTNRCVKIADYAAGSVF